MSRTRYIFLLLFAGLLAMSAVQFFMLEVDDLKSLNAVEEQQETQSNTIEVQALEFDGPRFFLFTECCSEDMAKNYSVIHQVKIYPPICIPVPYSPPELS
ncbi:MAG: hypothetical protein ACSHXL_04170 [Bacteroidota bacterium]